jgi:hypothetical protein
MCKDIFRWLLNKGLMTATLIVNAIFYIVLAIMMYILNWYHKHH